MRITDILTEVQLDEIGLGSKVGQAIGKGLTGLAKGYGYVAGIPQAMSRASQQGRAASMANIGYGKFASEPEPSAYDQELQRRLGSTDPGSMQTKITQLEKELQSLKQQLKTSSSQSQNLSPEQTRKTKQGAAAAAARTQMVPKPSAPPAAQPKSPEQARREKQATAAQAAQASMRPVTKTVAPPAPAPKSPEQIRKEKQALAAQTAQAQMASPKTTVSETPIFYSKFLQSEI